MVVAKFDYDKYYSNLLKNALKYGMTRNEFWYVEDWKEYYLYEEAYYERLHESSHIQGQYFYTAMQSILSMVFCKNDNERIEYPKQNAYVSYKEDIEKHKKIETLKDRKNLQAYRASKLKEYF